MLIEELEGVKIEEEDFLSKSMEYIPTEEEIRSVV